MTVWEVFIGLLIFCTGGSLGLILFAALQMNKNSGDGEEHF